jgi:hypothetical protein
MKYDPKNNRYNPHPGRKPPKFMPKQKDIWRQAYEIRKKREEEKPGHIQIAPEYKLRPGYEIQGEPDLD